MSKKLIEDLSAEITKLQQEYNFEIDSSHSLLKSYEGRNATTHLGWNLANRASKLSELAAKIEQTVSILSHVKHLAEKAEKSEVPS